jgi:acetylornithine deacetylase/succinyl-diaminopimelate desuccinylase-like protein
MSTPATANTLVQELLSAPQVQAACRLFKAQADQITEEQIGISAIAAPPFGEQQRAEYFRSKLSESGLVETDIDEAGNCLALYRGHKSAPALVISAHLDTVFPAETDLTLRHRGTRLLAPGISDDGCGLAALIALARALTTNKIQVETSILFVGSVGEEGEGNLRGVRHLFNTGKWAGRISAFVSLDGAGLEQITNGALGSRRYRVQLHGPGGHSWGDFGLANPVHALGRAISSLAAYPAPVDPRTSFNVGRVSGGSSINAIPGEASMEVDLRSISEDELVRLDAFFRRMVREAVEQENSNRRKETPPLELSLNLIGDRPSGETPAQSPIVSLAQEATRAVERTPVLERASTDSNVPIALGIPAITLGAGGTSGNQHTIDEWYDPRDRHLGLKRALLVMLGLAGLSPVLNTGKSN